MQSRGGSPAKNLSVAALQQRDALDNVPFTPSQGVVTPSPSNRALPPWQVGDLVKGFTRSPDTVLRLEPELAKTSASSPERPAESPPTDSDLDAPPPTVEQVPKRMNARQRRTERRRLEREARALEAVEKGEEEKKVPEDSEGARGEPPAKA